MATGQLSGYSGSPPGYDGPPPGYGQSPPGYGESPPGYGGPPPGYSELPSGYDGLPSGYATPAPQVKTKSKFCNYGTCACIADIVVSSILLITWIGLLGAHANANLRDEFLFGPYA